MKTVHVAIYIMYIFHKKKKNTTADDCYIDVDDDKEDEYNRDNKDNDVNGVLGQMLLSTHD